MEESHVISKQNCFEKIKNNLPRIVGILFVIGLSVYIYEIRDQAKQFAQYSYGGIFLFSFLANATIFLPAPSLLFVFAMSGVFHPLGVAIAASLGATLGEMTSYIAGFSGNAVIDNIQTYRKISDWMIQHKKFIGLFILLLAFFPFPLMDLVGIASGALKIPLSTFLPYCFAGKLLKMLAVAYAGSFSLNWFS